MRYDHLGEHFNQTFTHHYTLINGVNIHYVKGGIGKPLVLIHGYPQTWYAYRHIMPELAKKFSLIVPDLRGLGDSGKTGADYDTPTAADDIHKLVTSLGHESVYLLGHDLGANVAYAYAVNFPQEVERIAFLDVGMLSDQLAESPLMLRGRKSLWWFPFHMIQNLPEQLVLGKESIYLNWFYKENSFVKDAITEADLQEYTRCYSAAGGMNAGFNYYRALFKDIDFNKKSEESPMQIPVLAVGGEKSFGYIPYESWKKVAPLTEAAIIKDAGHYIAEEQPQKLLEVLLKFFY